MASEFEPTVRTEETPQAYIVVADLPGFIKEDLRVQVDKGGNIIISGERREKEIQETIKVGGRLEKMQREGNRFRKVISVPENLNFDAITAKFRDERLRITVPLLHISDRKPADQSVESKAEKSSPAAPASGKPADQSVESKAEKSSPATGQEASSMKEPSRGVAQGDQGARHPEPIQRDGDKAKDSVAADQESKRLVEERKTEAPKHAQDFVHGQPPISKDAVRERSDDQNARQPEVIQPPADHKAKPIAAAGESKGLVAKEKAEAPKHAKDFVGVPPLSNDPMQVQGDQGARHPEAIRPDDNKSKPNAAAEESKEMPKEEVPMHGQDHFVGAKPAPISKEATQEQPAVAQNDQSARHPEAIRPSDHKENPTAAAGESKELVGEVKAEAPKHAQDVVHGEPAISTHTQQVSAQAGSDRDESQLLESESKQDKEKQQQEEKEEDDEESEEADDEEEDETETETETETESDECSIPQTVTQIHPSTGLSMIYKDKVLIASTVLVLSVGLLSYMLRSQSSD